MATAITWLRLEALDDAIVIVDQHLHALQNKHYKEVAKAMGRPLEAVMSAMDFIRTLDPRPGLRYNKVETRLIEPDVAFIKQGDEYLVVMNDEEMPQLRLNSGLPPPAESRCRRKGRAQLRQGTLQVGHPAHQEHRAAQADHPARLLFDPGPPARISSNTASIT